jgi:PAS domain-containing protein
MQDVRFESTAEAMETLRLATEATGLGIWERNLRTGEVRWSRALSNHLRFEAGEPLRFERFLELVHPDDCDRVQRTVKAALDPEGRGEYDIECRICRPTCEVRWVGIRGRCLFEEIDGRRTGTRFLGTMMDRTEQKASQHALLQAEQMAATGRLAASIAHEINKPLEAVTNLLYLGRREPDDAQREASSL